jgi:hypothetical protein
MSQRSYVDTYFDIVWSQAGPIAPPEGGVSTTHLRAALTCIAKHATWKNGEGSYPIQDTLVGESGMSRAGLNRAIKCAVALGWLVKEKGAPNRSRGVTYKLVVPTAAQMSHGETSHSETTHHETNESVIVRQTNVSPCDTTHVSTHTLTQKEDKGRLVAAQASVVSQPAAAAVGQDSDFDQPKQAATGDAPSEASPELVKMLGTLLASRMAALVRKPEPVTPAMIRPTLRALKRWAGGDEGKVKEYLADELDRQESRAAHDLAAHPGVLLKWLADKKSWSMWQAAAASATPAAATHGPARDKSIPVGRPPKPGMRWNSFLGDWTNSTAQHTGILANLPGSDADDEVTR